MPEDAMSPQIRVRELLCRVLQNPVHLATLSIPDLDLAIRAARRVRLLGTLALRLRDANVLETLPAVARDQLQSTLAIATSRVRLALWELDRLSRALSARPNTSCAALKGCAYLLVGLPYAGGRIFADVDLMLPEDDLEPVEGYLGQHGWVAQQLSPYDDNYYRKWTHELPPLLHVEREVEIDLHHNVLPRTARLKPDGALLMAASKAVPGSYFRVLCDEDMVLHAMTHLMFNDDLADKLRDLVDIASLIDHFSSRDEAFWERFLERASRLDLRRAAFYGLRYVQRLLQFPLPDFVVAATRKWGPPAPLRRLMDLLVPMALFPPHPEHSSRSVALARLLLYVRSHWIRMPPWLLAFHLSAKFWKRRFARG